VLQAAMAEFGRHGYSGGNLNAIAQEAGVAKGSLFQYFENKFDLFAHTAEEVARRAQAHMAPWLGELDPDQSFFEFFAIATEAWVRYWAEHPVERGVTVATNLEVDPAARTAVREPIHRLYLAGLRPLLEQARARGELYADADLDTLLTLLLVLLPHLAIAPFEPGLDPMLYSKNPRELRKAIRRLLAAIFAGFGPSLVASAATSTASQRT